MANLLIAKTDSILSPEEYKKWHDLYKSMINSGFFIADGRFTLYSMDDNVERIEDKRKDC